MHLIRVTSCCCRRCIDLPPKHADSVSCWSAGREYAAQACSLTLAEMMDSSASLAGFSAASCWWASWQAVCFPWMRAQTQPAHKSVLTASKALQRTFSVPSLLSQLHCKQTSTSSSHVVASKVGFLASGVLPLDEGPDPACNHTSAHCRTHMGKGRPCGFGSVASISAQANLPDILVLWVAGVHGALAAIASRVLLGHAAKVYCRPAQQHVYLCNSAYR